MISSQRPANQPSQFVIQQLIRLFEIYIEGPEGCRQRSYRLLEQYPRTPVVIEIAAACDSLIGKHSEAIAGYQKCLEIAPKTLAYTNNQAWNFIQLKDYEIAMTLLSEIKDKWNHPAIYSNWATVLQNIGQNPDAVEQTIRKRDEFLRNYPQYKRQANNQLIHTFLLKSEDNYSAETEELRTEVFELVEVIRKIQMAPVSFQTLRERLQFMEEKIYLRKLQEQKSGFVIEPSLKIALAGLELLQTKILNNYQERYSEQLKKYVFKSIEFINDQLFSEKIGEKFDYKSFEESKLAPTVFQIIEIGQYMQEKLNHLTGSQLKPVQKMHQFQVPKQIPHEKPLIVEQKPAIDSSNIQLQQPNLKDKINEMHNQINVILEKINDSQKIAEAIKKSEQIHRNIPNIQVPQSVEPKQQQRPVQIQNQKKQIDQQVIDQQDLPENQKDQNKKKIDQDKKEEQINEQDRQLLNEQNGYHFCIRLDELQQIQREKAEFLVEKLRIEGQTQANPLFIVLRFRQNMKDSSIIYVNHRRINQQVRRQPDLLHIQRLNSQTQKAQVQRYYFVLKNILKFYNFYGTRNFLYKQKSVKSHLDCQHYLQIIAPVLNHIFEDEDYFSNYQVGNICQKIHSIMCNYINETRKKGDFLRSFNRILKRLHGIVQNNEKPVQNLLQSLLGQKNLQYSSILLNNQLINVDGSTKYHEYYIQRMNKDRDGNSNENWLIFNISVLIISTLEANDDSQSLQKRFLDCYYFSRITEPVRNLILKNFYNANHQVPLIEKVSLGFRNIFTKILP